MSYYQVQQVNSLKRINTGENNLKLINRLQKQKPGLQAPGNLYFPKERPSYKAPLIEGGRKRRYKGKKMRGGGKVIPHFGKYGDYLPPPIV